MNNMPRRALAALPALILCFSIIASPAMSIDLTAGKSPGLPGVLPEPKPAPSAQILDPHDPFGVRDRFVPLSNWPPAETDPLIDVLHYDLDLDFEFGGIEVAGTATLTIVWGSDPDDVLTLDYTQGTVSDVRDGLGGSLSYVQNASTLDITLASTPARDDTVTVAIDYSIPNSSSFSVGTNASYTFTEPNGSRAWFPCNDVPWDKATLTVAGTCIAADVLVSNGVLDSTVASGPNQTYYWREDHALATYLMAVAVGDYVAAVPPTSTITPLTWYVYPFHQASALNAFSNVDAMLQFYDSLLVPWPFDKYAQVEGNFGGGMEHQTCSLMAEFIVTNNKTYEWITAHELAHQYFGDWVTMNGWSHIWLNEGFATFYDIVWNESFYGAATFKSRMDANENSVISFEAGGGPNLHRIVDPPSALLFSTLIYRKGGWVLRMLRDLMGVSTYNAAITEYLTTYGGGNATTDDLKTIVEAHHGQDLTWFFDQWLYGTGSPRLVYTPLFNQFGDKWVVQIDINQEHGTPTLFTLPLEVRITTTAGDVTVSDWVTDWHQVLQFEVADQPLSVLLDPDNKLLGRQFEAATSGVDPGITPPSKLSVWPNPASRRVQIAGAAGFSGRSQLEVFDLAGRRVNTLGTWSTGDTPLIWNGVDESGRSVSPGVYFVRSRTTGEAVRVVMLPN